MSRNSSIGKVTGYELENWDTIPGKGKVINLQFHVQTAAGTQTTSYIVTSVITSSEVKRSKSDTSHLHTST
jgi:hypothetical protein